MSFEALAGFAPAAWMAVVLPVTGILASVRCYSPRIVMGRRSGIADWVAGLPLRHLHFVAAANLKFAVLGKIVS